MHQEGSDCGCIIVYIVHSKVTSEVPWAPKLIFCLQAFAELLHEKVRKTVWGYADAEALSAAELHKIKYEVSCTSLRVL